MSQRIRDIVAAILALMFIVISIWLWWPLQGPCK